MFEKVIVPYLEKYFESLDNKKVKDIIKYSVSGGKCIRGFIVKHIIEKLGTGDESNTVQWEPIVAVELIHAASLIVDDLPCMDNDKIRRNKPSTFVKYGKHEAILFSFFIISESIRLLNKSIQSPQLLNNMITEWCELLGKNLVIGQFLDLKGDAESYFNVKLSKTDSINDYIIKYKTCSLFSFSFLIGACFSNKTDDETIKDFKDMGLHFGMMFQLMDDYRDKDTDVPYANYVLTKGLPKAIEKYKESRVSLIILLQKHNLFTNKFETLIKNIDKLFV